jgi:ferredoxin-NADP reductase
METTVKIIEIAPVTHDVKYFRIAKPEGYQFKPGQATDVSIHQPDIEGELRPFTFTCLNEDPYLEFTIKRYPDHHGVTDRLHRLVPGDELVIRDVWGAIEYKGPGYFIAGGAGITPFMAILRQLHKNGHAEGNTLFFSNKTSGDIIYEKELSRILGKNARFILTREQKAGYEKGYLNASFLRDQIKNLDAHCYVCGPDPMILDINNLLSGMGVRSESLVFEK